MFIILFTMWEINGDLNAEVSLLKSFHLTILLYVSVTLQIERSMNLRNDLREQKKLLAHWKERARMLKTS